MALPTLTGTITAADLVQGFDDKTTTLTTQATDGEKDFPIYIRRVTLAAADDESLRVYDFTPASDYELRVMIVGAETTGSGVVTLALTQADGGTEYLLDKTWSESVTISGGGIDWSRTDYYTDVSGDRLVLKKGVTYRLTLSLSTGTLGANEVAHGILWVRGRRRRR